MENVCDFSVREKRLAFFCYCCCWLCSLIWSIFRVILIHSKRFSCPSLSLRAHGLFVFIPFSLTLDRFNKHTHWASTSGVCFESVARNNNKKPFGLILQHICCSFFTVVAHCCCCFVLFCCMPSSFKLDYYVFDWLIVFLFVVHLCCLCVRTLRWWFQPIFDMMCVAGCLAMRHL